MSKRSDVKSQIEHPDPPEVPGYLGPSRPSPVFSVSSKHILTLTRDSPALYSPA
jgi:hypothetical protein